MRELVLALNARFPHTPQALLLRAENPEFLIQVGLVVLAAIIAFWLGAILRGRIDGFILHRLPKAWTPTAARVGHTVAAPLVWLAIVWITGTVGHVADEPVQFIDGAADLLAAWVVIRLLSFVVRSPLGSAAISVIVWSMAALSILGLIDPLARVLDSSSFHFGQMRISALTVIHAMFVLVLLLWLATVLYRFLERQINSSTSLTPSLQALFIQLLKIFLPAAAIVIALSVVGVNLTAFTVASGALGLGIGFGLQRLVANLVAGLSLLIGKTIKPGDIIEYKDSYGWVTAMGARYVTLRTRDGVEHLVPNDYFLENGVENWSYSDVRLRLHVPVGIAYESDPHKAIALCIDAAKSVKRVLAHPEPICLVKGFGDSSVDLEIRVWIEDPRNGTTNVKSDVLLAVWDRFQAAGIRIPFPQRDVHIIPPS